MNDSLGYSRTMLPNPIQRAIQRWTDAIQGGARLDLHYILEQSILPMSAERRADWLASLWRWVQRDQDHKVTPATKVRFLLQWLDHHPEWKAPSAALIRSALQDASAFRLFTEVGVPSANVLTKEAFSRLMKIFFPQEEDFGSLSYLITHIVSENWDLAWLRALPAELQFEVIRWLRTGLSDDQELFNRLVPDARDACVALSVRAASISLREDISVRAPEFPVSQNPFLRLTSQVESYVRQFDSPQTRIESVRESFGALETRIAECHSLLSAVHRHLEETGVSVDLVFQLERATAYLDRLEALCRSLRIWKENDPEMLWRNSWQLFSRLAVGAQQDHRFRNLMRANFHLIARKIVERTGETGEGYITRNRAEYWHMFWMAAGGGAITAGTALAKYLGPSQGAPFFLALYAALNYSLSFGLMHFLHFKLATKQPSATAAALAGRLKENCPDEDPELFIAEVAHISRSQFAAVLGNISAVIPVALLMDLISDKTFGLHFLTHHQAEHVIESVHPLLTLTIFYAAVTGVLLWLSGLAAGWMENAFVYFRIDRSLESHRFLKHLMGRTRVRDLADFVRRNLSGVVGAVSLGFFLAFVPELGKFFGLPLDVRHITLTTGSLAFSVSSLGWDAIDGKTWISMLTGILFIGSMNFGVSFYLSMKIALRARNVEIARSRRLTKKILWAFVRNPKTFLFPSEKAPVAGIPIVTQGSVD